MKYSIISALVVLTFGFCACTAPTTPREVPKNQSNTVPTMQDIGGDHQDRSDPLHDGN